MENYYEILRINLDADERTIKKAYHTLVKEYHPDSPSSQKFPEASEKFRHIKEAYETLINEKARETYDKYVLKKPRRLSKDEDTSYIKKAAEYYEKGRKLYKAKKFRSSVRAFQTAMNLDPGNALYCSWLGIALSHSPGKLHEAREACEKAVKLSPYNADYHVNLAIIYRDAGVKSMAERYLRKALNIEPNNQRARSWLEEGDKKSFLKSILSVFGLEKKK